jgi:hypothetical protein
MIEGVEQGTMVFYMKKFNCEEDVYWNPYLKYLDDNADVKEELGINAIVYRKGEDGTTALPNAPGSEYSWRQLVCIIGEDMNTPEHRLEQAQKIIAHFNSLATTEMYRYPRKARFGSDLSSTPRRPVDAVLLDREVVGLMLAAYPTTTPFTDLIEYEEIMQTFWTDPTHGADVMESFVSNHGGGANEEG